MRGWVSTRQCLGVFLALTIGLGAPMATCGASAVASPHRDTDRATLAAKPKPKPKPTPKPRPRTVKNVGPGVLGGVVPDWAIAAFATFEQPRATSLPRDMVRLFTGAKPLPMLRTQGVDYHEARQLDVAGRRFYLVPGQKAICIFYPRKVDSGSAVCLNNGPFAYLFGINVDIQPPPSEQQVDEWLKDRSKPYPVHGSPVVTVGVAPRGVTQVLLHAQPDEDRVAAQVGEGYVGETKDIVYSRTFSGPSVPAYNSAPYTPLK
jgi:hypothetical protein